MSDVLQSFSNCFDPQRIYNKYTYSLEYVSCGKCAACVNRKANVQTARVRNEIKQHRYSVMFTLTYNNDSLPRMRAIMDANGKVQLMPVGRYADLCSYSPLNYFDEDVKDYSYYFDDSTFLPRIESEEVSYEFGVVCKRDVQNFMKRLRWWISKDKDFNNEDRKLRYYIASEYGPKTYRPHYHGVLFFDSERLLSKIKDFIVKSWGRFERKQGINRFVFRPFASVRLTYDYIKQCDPNTAFYVASYVAGNLDLPQVLQLRSTRPWHIQSKGPIIGCYKVDYPQVFSRISRGFVYDSVPVFDKSSGCTEIVDMVFSSSLLDSVWSKCFQYRNLSFDAKSFIYGFYSSHYDEWLEVVQAKADLSGCSLRSYLHRFPDESYRSYCLVNYSFEYELCNFEKDVSWYASKRAHEMCSRFDFSRYYGGTSNLHAYLMLFDKLLYLKQQLKLKSFYELQDRWIEVHGLESVFCAYPFFFEDLPNELPTVKGLDSKNFRLIRSIDKVSNFYRGRYLNRRYVDSCRESSFVSYGYWRAVQRQKFADKNKRKKLNNEEVNGYRRIY